jgi:hypothetical protein
MRPVVGSPDDEALDAKNLDWFFEHDGLALVK